MSMKTIRNKGMAIGILLLLLISGVSVVRTIQLENERALATQSENERIIQLENSIEQLSSSYEELEQDFSILSENYVEAISEYQGSLGAQRHYTGNPFTTQLWPGQLQAENITGMHWYTEIDNALYNRTDVMQYPAQGADYIVYVDTVGIAYAKNATTGQVDFYGANVAVVITAALDAIPTAGGVHGKVLLLGGTYTLTVSINMTKGYSHLSGMGYGTLIQGPVNKYAIRMGDNVSTYDNQILSDMRIDGDGAAYGGINIQKVDMVTVLRVRLWNMGTGIRIYGSDNPRIYDVVIRRPRTYGIWCGNPPATIKADFWFNNVKIVQTFEVNVSVGMYFGEGINGISLINILIHAPGIKHGIIFEGAAFSGSWLSHVIIDSISGTGIKFLSTTDHSGLDVEITNSWLMNCGEHGLFIVGSAAKLHVNFVISNTVFRLNDLSGAKLECVRGIMFTNCIFQDNAQANLVGNEAMTNVLIKGDSQVTFDHCWFAWDYSIPANRGQVVRAWITNDNQLELSARFSNCLSTDAGNITKARIGYMRQGAAFPLNLYSADFFTKAVVSMWHDELGNGATTTADLDTVLGATFNW